MQVFRDAMQEFEQDITSAAGAGAAVGTLVVVSSLSEVQGESYTEATVLLVQHIGGEEDIPEVR